VREPVVAMVGEKHKKKEKVESRVNLFSESRQVNKTDTNRHFGRIDIDDFLPVGSL